MSSDPFGTSTDYEKHPSIKFPTVGTEVLIDITEVGAPFQGEDYTTGEPKTTRKGKPKLTYTVTGAVGGTMMVLFVDQYTRLATAIAEAIKEAGSPLGPGGQLWVKHTGMEKVEGTRFEAKAYAAAYKPGKTTPADPFKAGEETPF